MSDDDVDYEVIPGPDGTPQHRWRRDCPQCRMSLEKLDPTTTITCECGWEWT